MVKVAWPERDFTLLREGGKPVQVKCSSNAISEFDSNCDSDATRVQPYGAIRQKTRQRRRLQNTLLLL